MRTTKPQIGRIHDRAVLDALEALEPEPFNGIVWRVTRTGREPLRGTAAHGRWSPGGEFEVLYTSLEHDGALAEIGYRLSLEPVWPSRIEHEVHAIEVQAERTLRFANTVGLAPLGVDVARYRTFDYQATHAIAAAAHFLEFDGLIVPNARFDCSNLIIFAERAPGLTLIETRPVDWDSWRRNQRR
jgi:RES domain